MGDKLLWVTSFALNSGAKFEPLHQIQLKLSSKYLLFQPVSESERSDRRVNFLLDPRHVYFVKFLF